MEREIATTDILRRLHPIRSRLIPYGSQSERLLLGFKKAILFPLGIFNKAKRQKIRYILKNYGIGALIAATIESARVTFVEGLIGRKLVNQVKQNKFVVLVKTKKREYKTKQDEYGVQTQLKAFLSSNAVLELPKADKPVITVVLLFYNRAEMSLQCLQSLTAGAGSVLFEVIIVDNASSDQTPALLDRIQNATIIRNPTNTGFGGGNNQAADVARGKYLLFLNNDTKLLPDTLSTLLETLEADPSIGAVGGKLIFPDGRLQEAGSLLWRDGSALGYGRFDDPFQPEYCYVREVDFCSAALLLTPRELFLSWGKFDPRYAPAYYEDADYCVQLWTKGYRVVFQPFAAAIHYEYGSSGSERALALQREHRLIFADKWKAFLAQRDMPDPSRIIQAREHHSDKKHILLIDDRVPDYHIGHGFPRTYKMLELLVDMGYKLTFFPMQLAIFVPDITESLQKLGIEVIYKRMSQSAALEGLYPSLNQRIKLEDFLKSRLDYFDVIFISRPHNMQEGLQYLKNHTGNVPIVYDAEALFALRDIKYHEIIGEPDSELEKEHLVKAEVALVKAADAVITVSEFEKQHFVKYGTSSVHVLSHILQPTPTPAPFEERRDILFIGSILFDPSPNADAARYFATQILPLVRQEVDCDFYIVGTNRIKAIWKLESEHVHVVGKVEDLVPYYNRSRLFVVPTRYSAGIPLKLLEASAHGLPAVVTPLTAAQLGWQEDRDLLVGHNPEDFARKVVDLYTHQSLFETLRHNALERIRTEYNPENFRQTLQNIIGTTVNSTTSEKSSTV